jgi:hypothetical protein
MRIVKWSGAVLAMLLFVSPSWAQGKTWSGAISDSNCNGKHDAKDEHGKKMSDTDCTNVCIKKGAQYVFASTGKVFKIANQDFADLKAHAGHRVMLTGDMKGDTITVSKIEMPAAKGKK